MAVDPLKDGRGHYDRSSSASQRAQEARALILDSARSLLTTIPLSELTVQAVIERARIGRNTFYSHFQNLSSLLQTLLGESEQSLWSRYASLNLPAPTPIAQLQNFAEAWTQAVVETPQITSLLFRHQRSKVSQRIAEELQRVYRSCVRDGLFAPGADAERLSALVAALLDLAESALAAPQRKQEISQIAADLLLKGLR